MARVMLLGTSAHPSGASLALLRLAQGLRERGHDTEACFLYQLEAIAAPAHPFTVLHPVSEPSPVDYAAMVGKTLWRLLRGRPEALISFLPLASVVGQTAAYLAGVPARIVSHRVVANTYGAAMRRLDGLLSRFGAYTDVFAVSAAVKSSCTHYPVGVRERITIAHNGLAGWSPSKLEKAEARAHFGIPNSQLVLVALGRLEPQKNLAILLQAVAPIEEAILVFAGDGSLRRELENEAARQSIAHRVLFLGAIPPSEVPHLLNAVDLFVQPSLFEGQSNALLEAMTAGLPALVSDIPEQREVLTEPDGRIRAGKLLATDRSDAWTAAIGAYRSDPRQMALAGAAAAERSHAFSYDAMIDAYDRVLRARNGKTRA